MGGQGRLEIGAGGGDGFLVGGVLAGRSELESAGYAAQLLELPRGVAEHVLVYEHLGAGVRDDVLELGDGEAPVERHVDGAELGAGELELETVGRVVGESRDAVALLDVELVAKRMRQPRGALLHLGVGEAASRVQVDERRLSRSLACVIGHPVVVLGCHAELSCRCCPLVMRVL